MARETIKRRLVDAGVEPTGQVRGHAVYALKDAVRAYLEGTDEGQDPDRLRPFERKAHYDAERQKLMLQIERGDLCSRIEVERLLARLYELMGRFLDTLPDHFERRGAATAVQLEILEELMDELREDLYQQIRQESMDADSAAEASG